MHVGFGGLQIQSKVICRCKDGLDALFLMCIEECSGD